MAAASEDTAGFTYGDARGFCGIPYGGQAICPSGYPCEFGTTVVAVAATQCVRESGMCPCQPVFEMLYATDLGFRPARSLP